MIGLRRRNVVIRIVIYSLIATVGCARTDGGPTSQPVLATTFHGAPKPLSRRAGTVTEDWPAFLGARHNMVSRETKLLETWPKVGPNVVWERQTGSGYAAPAVAGDRLVFFHRLGDEEIVECMHPETGKLYWSHRYACDYEDRWGYSNGPRSSPVIADGRVFTFGVQGVLHSLDLATGKVIWQRKINDEYHVKQNFFGVGSTPLVEGNLLIVQVGAPGGPEVIGVDRDTGQTVWTAGDEWSAGYASPVPAVIHGRRRVLMFNGGESTPTNGGLLSIEPATGAMDFRFPFRGKRFESVNASNPVSADNQVFISSCYRTGGTMLNITPELTAEVAWKTDELGAHWAMPIIHDGYLYGVNGYLRNPVSLVCLEVATGKLMWRTLPSWNETVERNGQPVDMPFDTGRCWLIFVDGRVLCLGEDGHLLWLDLTPQGCKVLQRTWLFNARETWSPPVIARGLLYVCQNTPSADGKPTRLLCYDLRQGQ